MDIRLVVFSIVLVAVTGHPHQRRCPMSTDIRVIRMNMYGERLCYTERSLEFSYRVHIFTYFVKSEDPSLSLKDDRYHLFHYVVFDSFLSGGIGSCRKMMRHKPSVCDLIASDRLYLILERVTITSEVLASLSTSAVSDPASQSLMMFLKIKDDLLICRESPGHSKTPSEKLKPWLHHLQHFVEEESSQCLQEAVLLSLISLLVEDIGCWPHGK
ncbi:uncharacterized protein LOC142251801 [Anomaloglossus baeobatrachus]|uniref:uncharacterized protein LOC142251801 n=1 Tax=Anomaloglossus baeobatrachus TaxID=238106 RepID=UPI003F507476